MSINLDLKIVYKSEDHYLLCFACAARLAVHGVGVKQIIGTSDSLNDEFATSAMCCECSEWVL